MENYRQIVIIGAGAAGIGMAVVLKKFGFEDVCIFEKGAVGESFRNWPKTTRFITPSFTTNGFGFPDINAITPDTSPAFSFDKEHMSGEEYSQYLEAVAEFYDLDILEDTPVDIINKNGAKFEVEAAGTTYHCEYLFVASGDYSFPKKPFEHGRHYSEIADFSKLLGDHQMIIGGNESGFDAAINLAEAGRTVDILTRSTSYNDDAADPSFSLSPYTHQRFSKVMVEKDAITVNEGCIVKEIEFKDDLYHIHLEDQATVTCVQEPILATGFDAGQNPLVSNLFDIYDDRMDLTALDESTCCRNAFLIGATVENDKATLCYIYKFRARFAVLARLIADREKMTVDNEVIDYYRQNQMYLDDYDCCEVDCSC